MAQKEVKVKIGLDDELTPGLKKTGQNVKAQSDRMTKSLNGLGKSFKGLAVAAGSFFAARKVLGFMSSSIALADVQIKSQALLGNALGKSTKAIQAQAVALQKLTLFGDEETIAAQARLAAFTKEESAIMRLTPLVQDFATAKSMDLAGAAELIGKSFGSSTNALARYGIQITGAAKSTDRLNQLTDALEEAVGGASRSVAEAGAGPIKQMQNAMGDLAESIGFVLLPSINAAALAVKGLTEKAAAFFAMIAENQKEGKIKKLTSELTELQEQAEKGVKISVITTGPGAGAVIRTKLTSGERSALADRAKEIQAEIEKLQAGPQPTKGAGGVTSAAAGLQEKAAQVIEFAGLPEFMQSKINEEFEAMAADQELPAGFLAAFKLPEGFIEDETTKVTDFALQLQSIELTIAEETAAEKQKIEEREALNAKRMAGIKLGIAMSFANSIGQVLDLAGKKSKEAAVAAKAVAITEAVISTALAANKAYAAGMGLGPAGLVIGPLAAAAALVAGGVQIATIASAKFADGGVVPGQSFSGDGVNVRANSGELILNNRQQSNLFRAIDGGGLGGPSINLSDTIVINGNADESTVNAIVQTRENQLFELKEMLSELKLAGQFL